MIYICYSVGKNAFFSDEQEHEYLRQSYLHTSNLNIIVFDIFMGEQCLIGLYSFRFYFTKCRKLSEFII